MDLVREGDTGELDLEDPQLEEKLVNELKAQGVFDQFRKDCLSDVDTKPAYQNLRVRVDKSVSSYLSKTTWRPTLNKNQLRNQLRKYIQDMSGVEAGVDRIVDQIVNPKLNTSFMPEVENVIYKYFGTTKPEEGADDMVNGNNLDDENSQVLPNGDSNHEIGGKISTRNLSAISSDAEMLNFDNNSVGSSPGPGLAGNVSPLTPGGSPKVNQGDISPLTPNTTPPPPLGSTSMEPRQVEPSTVNMETETPPPPPPGEELKIEEIVSMEVDSEELLRPQSAYTPPLPPANNTNHSTPEKSYTPPLPLVIPPCPPNAKSSGPPSPHTPPLPPLPQQVVGDDSGGEASMSSISDTDLGDISPPRHRDEFDKTDKKGGDSASDVSEEELKLCSDVGETSKHRESESVTPDKDTGSDEDLQQLERMKAELMAQLEGDFKLSPEESDSEGEIGEGEHEPSKDSPTSPDHSASSRSETPAAKQPSPTSANSSPNQLQKLRTLPLPSPDFSSSNPHPTVMPPEPDRIRSELVGDVETAEASKNLSSPDTLISGPRTPPMPMSRTPSQSPSPPPRKGPQTPPSPPSAFSTASRPPPRITTPNVSQASPVPPSTPPQEGLSKLNLNDPKTVESACKPFTPGGPKTPPNPDNDPEGFGGSSSNIPAPEVGSTSSSQGELKKSTSSTESSDQKTPANKSSNSSSSSRSHHSSYKHHSSSKDRKSEKKLDKIKEQTKAKIEKYEQKIKSKDKLKSDKFLDLDIFSTTKKPTIHYQPRSRTSQPAVTSGSNTPVSSKPPQRDFEKKLEESIKKVVQIREEEKEKRRREEEKRNAFKMPVKIEDRRRSSSGESIKERRSSKDDKDSSRSKDRHEKDKKERKSSTDKERRHSQDEKKEKERRHSEEERKEHRDRDSKYEKEREKQALESKRRLQEAREKKEKEERDRKRIKDKDRREKEKKLKDDSRKDKSNKDTEKPKDRSKTEDILKSKIGALGSDNIEKMLVEALAEKTGAKFSEDEKKEMLKKLEGLIKKKKDAKESSKKKRQSEEKSKKKVTPKKNNRILESSSSESSDVDSESETDHKIKELKNRIRDRRKSSESEKSGGMPSKRTRPVRNRIIKPIKVEPEQPDIGIKKEILEKVPINQSGNIIETQETQRLKIENSELKVEATETVSVKNEAKIKSKSRKNPTKKILPQAQIVKKNTDVDPKVENLVAFSQSDVDFMVSLKEKYDTLLKDEDSLSVSSVTSQELNAAIPPSRTVVIDAGPDPEETLRIMKQFGGNPRLFTPVPEWLHPYLIGAKVKLEDVGMPTQEEIREYIQKKETKSKKRGAGWDIVVEWVPTAPPPAKKTKLEKELGFDVDSSFGQTVAMSGGKRTRRANRKYSESEYSGEDVTAAKTGTEPTDQDQPNPAPVIPTQPSTTVRTHLGSSQTPKRGGKAKRDSQDSKQNGPSKNTQMEIDIGEVVRSDKVEDSPVSPCTAEDRAGTSQGAETKKVILEGIVQNNEEISPGKKRRSKDIIAAYLTSAGVERGEEKHDIVETVEEKNIKPVDVSTESIIAVSNGGDDKETVVAMLDAEISAADEELNAVLKNLKRKRALSGDSKFHGWEAQSIARPRTGFSILRENSTSAQLETVGASFGMTDIDFLMSSEESQCLLEVVMSQPMLRDIKKVETLSIPGVVGVKPLGNHSDESLKGKQSDSDNDERGAHSPSSFGSTKENVPEIPEIYNSVPPNKFNQKNPSAKRRLKNPVLKTSVKVS